MFLPLVQEPRPAGRKRFSGPGVTIHRSLSCDLKHHCHHILLKVLLIFDCLKLKFLQIAPLRVTQLKNELKLAANGDSVDILLLQNID